jgi:preprotein translocase subunit SecD
LRRHNGKIFLAIVAATIGALIILWPGNPGRYFGDFFPWPKGHGISVGGWERPNMKLGLDLQGGTRVVIEGDMSDIPEDDRGDAIKAVQDIIERRINAFGVSEPEIVRQGSNRIIIDLPGEKDPNKAVRLIGQTAELDFREQVTDEAGNPVPDANGQVQWKVATAAGNDGQVKELMGRYLKRNTEVRIERQTNQPTLYFEFNDEGGKMFGQITQRLIGKPLGIFLDGELISAPTVKSRIESSGIIENLSLDEARKLRIQLNAGALPVPIKIVQQEDVDASLGKDSLDKSILAGEVGLGVVILFMMLYYRLPGLLASCALVVYAILTLTLFKLLPVTLTLAGIAAFILTVGMAVDANILIFERLREELRGGRTLSAAIDAGFARAWPSIRDSNVSTLITCLILYFFGDQFGTSMVKGFALTLAVGVLVSMFTAIVVTRTFLFMVLGSRWAKRGRLFMSERAPAPVAST